MKSKASKYFRSLGKPDDICTHVRRQKWLMVQRVNNFSYSVILIKLNNFKYSANYGLNYFSCEATKHPKMTGTMYLFKTRCFQKRREIRFSRRHINFTEVKFRCEKMEILRLKI